MRISAKASFGGHAVLDVRRLLRRAHNGLSVEIASTEMDVDASTAKALLDLLEAEGYIERNPKDEGWWRNTVNGNAFAMASAAVPLKRSGADAMFLNFLARVEQVREEPRLCFKVDRVVLFGSYLSDAPTLGDIDLAVALRPAHGNPIAQKAAEKRSRDAADRAGRQFPNMVAHILWPQQEVLLFLKARKRLSLHDPRMDQPIIEAGPHVTVYADDKVCRSAMPLLRDWSDDHSNALRQAAAKSEELRIKKRDAATLKRIEKETAETEALLARVQSMGPDELTEQRKELTDLLAKFDKRKAALEKLRSRGRVRDERCA